MALGGPSGGAGGSAGVTRAITRLEVLDPHVVQLMRDVMDSSETSPRLKVQAGAAGGGGGGGAFSNISIKFCSISLSSAI